MSKIENIKEIEVKEKPTRKHLLQIIGELQGLIGKASGFHGNDRDPNGFENGQNCLTVAHELCISATRFDPPQKAYKQ